MRTATLPLSAFASALAVALLLTGCAASGKPQPSAAMPSEDAAAWAYFLDTGDGGDDIWNPGCHYKCTDPECVGGKKFWGGDFCSGNDLQEWTNDGPHAAESDIARHNCDAACKANGASGGRCVPVERACDDTYQSSRCECDSDS